MADEILKGVAESFKQPVATQVLPASAFYPAEEYHQDFHTKTPLKYRFYKYACGRVARLEAIWGKPTS